MNTQSFLAHHQTRENPFAAEEARLDPVFERLADQHLTHPEFPKILGTVDRPSTAVVFGEKGSGKTAIRLLIGKAVREHNAAHPDRRVMLVPYDELNPVIDAVLRSRKQNAAEALSHFRLEDHQDAILSLAVTRLVDAILGEAGDDEETPGPAIPGERLRRMPLQARRDLALLAALYDNPPTAAPEPRWARLRRKLRLGWRLPVSAAKLAGMLMALGAAALYLAYLLIDEAQRPIWLVPGLGLAVAGAVAAWSYWLWRHATLWWTCRQIHRDVRAIRCGAGELRDRLGDLGHGELARQPLPIAPSSGESPRDSRYQLTRRLTGVLGALGYAGLFVLVDRVDEPTAISGDPDRMRALVWPMFDNKFLQQDRIGLKLLLPIELRHMIHRESPRFFQEARLDKQNLVDRLTWSGATLYDLCSSRLRACRDASAEPITLADLFEEDVTPTMLIDALDQMHQPRDAFKFLYAVIQEHCRLSPEDEPRYRIARLTLESVRRAQSQRVQELYRGLSPA